MFINGILQYRDYGIPARNRYLTFKQSFFGLVPVNLQKTDYDTKQLL